MKRINIAIAGNPNCGKTTLFNQLTGARQRVGNWPGVTVERIEGDYTDGDTKVHVTDLPGIYSFSAYSTDEKVAREHILTSRPDLVLNIVDATNLERNLFLTTQLLEMKVPLVVALSMTDVARKRRIRIELDHLARHLGCPVVPLVTTRGEGLAELRRVIRETAAAHPVPATRIAYDSELEKAIGRVAAAVAAPARARGVDARWLALKLLDHDAIADDAAADPAVRDLIVAETRRVEAHTGEELDIVLADGRYGFIHGLVQDVVHRELEIRRNVSDAIDKVVLNRIIGIPLFLAVMYLVFLITINGGEPFIAFFDILFGTVFVDGFGALLAGLGAPAGLVTLLADGLGGGVQTVATFIPPIFLIFLCLAFLEDSGYMARAAFVMDRSLRTVGLPGKAFIPMLVGFGCNVPAILATRTLENERDRILTIMMNPFMSCGARLPVYALFAAAFFPRHGGPVIFALYIIGIVLAILTGLLFKRTILRGEAASFVMELPPYHIPTLRGILYHTWTRLKSFMLRAGQVVLVAVVILSVLGAIGTDGSFGHQDSESSVLSSMSKAAAPVFAPMGLKRENWPGAVGLVAGLFAKEAVVGTLDTLYTQLTPDAEDDAEDAGSFELWAGIRAAFAAIPAGFRGEDEEEGPGVSRSAMTTMVTYFDGQAGAFAYLLFVLIYAPCVAAIGAIYRETNLKWAIFAVCYLTLLAWMVSTCFYQTATFAQAPARATAWIAVTGGLLALLVTGLTLAGRRRHAR